MEVDTEIRNMMSEWLKSGYSKDEVITMLNDFPISDKQKAEYSITYQRSAQLGRTRAGFIYLGIGGFLGFVSCVFSMIIDDHFINSCFLYGGTSIAILLAFVGFYFIFE